MKIAHALPYYFYVGSENPMVSVVQQTLNLAMHQQQAGHDVTIIGAKNSYHPNLRVIDTSTNLKRDFTEEYQQQYYQEVSEISRQEAVDILHVHVSRIRNIWPHVETSPDTSSVYSIRTTNTPDQVNILQQAYEDHNPNIVWISKQQKKLWGGRDEDSIVYHGVNTEAFNLPIEGRKKEKELLFMARLVPDKGAHIAVKVAQKLDMPLTVVGEAYTNNPFLSEYFNKEIKAHFNDKIKYAGQVKSVETIDYYQNHGVFINPICWDEAFGLTMVEAPLSGCPVVAFNRGAAAELISNGKNGFVVPPNDIERFTEAVKSALELSPKDVRAASLNFSLENNHNNLMKTYQNIRVREQKVEHTLLPKPSF